MPLTLTRLALALADDPRRASRTARNKTTTPSPRGVEQREPSGAVQATELPEIGSEEPAGPLRADVVGRAEEPPVTQEVALGIGRLPEPIHDRVEIVGVREAESVAHLVERGEIQDELLLQRVPRRVD